LDSARQQQHRIRSLFQYEALSVVNCSVCQTSSPIDSNILGEDAYVFDLHLPCYLDARQLGNRSKIDFIDLLDFTLRERTIDFSCPLGHLSSNAIIINTFSKLPNIVIFRVLSRRVIMERFVSITNKLNYPLDNLELTCGSKRNTNNSIQAMKQNYNLIAIVYYKPHTNKVNNLQGHYSCYIRFDLLRIFYFFLCY